MKPSSQIIGVVLVLLLITGLSRVRVPTETRGSLCPRCGWGRSEVWKLGSKVEDNVHATPVSSVVERLAGPCERHAWIATSSERYGTFFDGESACGGGGPVMKLLGMVAEASRNGNEREAARLLRRYHEKIDHGYFPDELEAYSEAIRVAPITARIASGS